MVERSCDLTASHLDLTVRVDRERMREHTLWLTPSAHLQLQSASLKNLGWKISTVARSKSKYGTAMRSEIPMSDLY